MQPPAPENPVITSVRAALAINLADEGVPVRAIARSVKVPSEAVYELLKEALQNGRIIELPKDDWPPGSRTQRSRGERDILTIDDGALHIALSSIFRLTRLQSIVLLTLLRRTQATKDQLHNAIESQRHDQQDPTDKKMVDVVICHIRRKLKDWAAGYSHCIPPEIKTTWGIGYSIAPSDRDQIVSAMGAFLADPIKVK